MRPRRAPRAHLQISARPVPALARAQDFARWLSLWTALASSSASRARAGTEDAASAAADSPMRSDDVGRSDVGRPACESPPLARSAQRGVQQACAPAVEAATRAEGERAPSVQPAAASATSGALAEDAASSPGPVLHHSTGSDVMTMADLL